MLFGVGVFFYIGCKALMSIRGINDGLLGLTSCLRGNSIFANQGGKEMVTQPGGAFSSSAAPGP